MIAKQPLGKDGPAVGCLGYGAMVLEGYYGGVDEDPAVETIRHAIDEAFLRRFEARRDT